MNNLTGCSHNKMPKKSKACNHILFFLAICMLHGCGTSIKKQPFIEFTQSVEAFRSGADKVVDSLITKQIDSYKKNLTEELEQKKSTELFSKTSFSIQDGDPLSFSSVPSYFVFDQFIVGLRAMTDSLHEYSVILNNIAGNEIQSEAEFKEFSAELNSNAFEALNSIDNSVSKNGAENVGLISAVAATAFNNYLSGKNSEALVDAITKNQPSIELYTERAMEAIALIAGASNKNYDDLSNEYKNQMLDQNLRTRAINELINLNLEHYSLIQTLNALHKAVEKYPAAHKELINAALSDNNSLTNMIALVNQANKLEALIEESQQSNATSLLEINSRDIEAQAIELEVESKLLKLEASNAQAEAVIARIEANADSNNVNKEQKAIALEAIAQEKKAIADLKEADAKLMRDAANAVKNSINNINQ